MAEHEPHVGRAVPGAPSEPGRHSLPYAGRAGYHAGRAVPDIAPQPSGRAHARRAGQVMTWSALLLLTACSGDPGTGPVEVKWDRDACARCNMVLSDRQHSAQVRFTPIDGKRSQVKKFDDLGCAVLWLDQQPWRDAPGVELWVSEQDSGEWIDARSAHYITGKLTPMQYGLGAQRTAGPDTLDFARAREHVYAVEQTYNVHGGNLDHPNAAESLPAIQGGAAASGK